MEWLDSFRNGEAGLGIERGWVGSGEVGLVVERQERLWFSVESLGWLGEKRLGYLWC